ncbi:hypothetical protein D3C87_1491080 [compost metagenome]
MLQGFVHQFGQHHGAQGQRAQVFRIEGKRFAGQAGLRMLAQPGGQQLLLQFFVDAVYPGAQQGIAVRIEQLAVERWTALARAHGGQQF